MLTKKKLATTAAASFGAAMASLHCAPELQADIVELSFAPGSVAFGSLGYVFINEVGASFAQWNDSVGQTILAGGTATTTFLEGIRIVSYSQTLEAGTFPDVGTGSTALPYGSNSGTVYFGFHYQGNVGWFSANLGGGGAITYTGGEFGSDGEAVHVGGTIPEPSAFAALAGLAAGAVGIRRRRK